MTAGIPKPTVKGHGIMVWRTMPDACPKCNGELFACPPDPRSPVGCDGWRCPDGHRIHVWQSDVARDAVIAYPVGARRHG